MLDHLTLKVRDIDRSIAFYTQALAPLGYIVKAHHEPTLGFGVDDGTPHSDFYLSPADEADHADETTEPEASRPSACPVTHIAFLAQDKAAVCAFYMRALAAGGRDNGAPGPRPYHPGYYSAFILDPDGNNVEAVTDWSGWYGRQETKAREHPDQPEVNQADTSLPDMPGSPVTDASDGPVTARSSSERKIKLFRSLFRGRDDVYAHGFVSRKTGKTGYAPAAWNEWTTLASGKRIPTPSGQRRCKPLTDQVLLDHFTKRDERLVNVVGLYPMSKESTVWFLAIDFDDDGWRDEIMAVRNVCKRYGIEPAMERSRSGDGGHLWLFLDEPMDAAQVRHMGDALLTEASDLVHIEFRSYDRMFPNQDVLPSGGFGNLIALPLQRMARDNGNSVFIDEQFNPYPDQWAYLASIKRVVPEQVRAIAARMTTAIGPSGNPASGAHRASDKAKDNGQPSGVRFHDLSSTDTPRSVTIIECSMLVIPKDGMTQAALNAIRRLAAFANPDFYRAQAMRQPIYDKPRIIYRGEETDDNILLPRGCKESLTSLLSRTGTVVSYRNERNPGERIQVEFTGTLRERQNIAAQNLLAHDDGILTAPTGFGKTVIAANLIAERKTNALIILRSSALLEQWRERLEQFLDITATLPPLLTRTGRVSRRKRHIIGQIGTGRNEPNGIVDIALAQSLFDKGDIAGTKHVKDVVSRYGMIIFDECHHVASPDTEAIARETNAKYVYGFTGTLKRDDGMQPIVTMRCGPVRDTIDVNEHMATQRFSRRYVPRFTATNYDLVEPYTYHEYLEAACGDEDRNTMIVNDAMTLIDEGRTPLLLTKRIEHAQALANALQKRECSHVILLYGAETKKSRHDKLEQLKRIPSEDGLAVVSTGSYIGEGFDCRRLDTLMLTAPVSVEASVAQYVGRLHRDNEGKREVRVYDYIDVTIPMAASMYRKRLKTYAAQGYTPMLPGSESDARRQAKTKALLERKNALAGQRHGDRTVPIINADEFHTMFRNDIRHCRRTITLCAGYLTRHAIDQVTDVILEAAGRGVAITVNVRVPANATETSRSRTTRNMDRLRALGCSVQAVNACTEFAVFDDELIWFGTIDLLGRIQSDDCSLRFADARISRLLVEGVNANETMNA
ncbi:type III restriction endonuclease [Bifidobacterium stellenboschense]|uniref:Type III restriction endonuclease n=1 Tax=Bifidobacterium stellenboschense TaxID=762211 RepID=A0A087DPK3_9BIFI|nr:DEAD/DEAH box helicase family protein [Bifidobacterium stellenboschense]KFI97453.1 type III restriction endonuclease [Bifidobacterium stellenboschense]